MRKSKKKKVCKDCKILKPLDEFPNQVKYIKKLNHETKGDGKRTDCKECHKKKCRKAYLKRTTPEQRREYMRNYMRKYKTKRRHEAIH